MKRIVLTLLWTGLLSGTDCFGQSELIEHASMLELQGKFKEAAESLTNALGDLAISSTTHKQLEFEADRLERIKKDFPFSKVELFAELRKAVKGLTAEEYDRWVAEERFDSRTIDGQRRFMGSSVSNLFFRFPELYARRLPPKNSSNLEWHHWQTCAEIRAAALAEKKPYVLPKRFEVVMKVTAEANAASPGELLRAWLPIPRDYPFQNDFELLSASPSVNHLDDKLSEIRSVYLAQPARKNKATEFKVVYAYTIHGVWFDIKPSQVLASKTNDVSLSPYVSEAPHIVFTPEIRALSQQIAGDEMNPAAKARRFYEWIADHIKYSYAIEYSTIRNISDYCRSHGYGDCGQEALLFMTLCRLNGIPARWQSGWNTFPGEKAIHDWTEIYLAPYGWIPVDPYMGIYATRYATTLTPEQRREIRDFYFGGLDQYRMIANGDHNQTLNPPKNSLRSDDVDFQRGELEYDNHNIYFDQYSYALDLKEVKLPRGRFE